MRRSVRGRSGNVVEVLEFDAAKSLRRDRPVNEEAGHLNSLDLGDYFCVDGYPAWVVVLMSTHVYDSITVRV